VGEDGPYSCRDRLDRAEAERRTREYMRTMPLWKDHPALADG